MNLLKKTNKLAGDYFAIIVILVSGFALYHPHAFTWVLPHIIFLLGVIMFGMGMTLKTSDFKIIFTKPKPVLLGVIAQYTIMPLLAYVISTVFKLPPQLAVGVILVGTCPGGTASNVITYLAKGDVALSVAMTSVSTLLAPLLTPLITLVLAGKWIPIAAGPMFLSIFKMVLIPVVLGIGVNRLLGNKGEKISTILPLVSVVSIVLIIGAVVGVNSEKILSTAVTVFGVVILHNVFGLILGYMIGKKLGISKAKRRAIAIEVGMQNSGLAVSLAMAHFTPLAAIPGAIFSVWHNISGPILATYWSKRN